MTRSNQKWERKPLGNFASVVSGYAFKSAAFCDTGIPVIKIKNIRVGFVDLSDAERVDENFLTLPERYHVRAGDVLVSLTGSHISQPNSVVGRVARVGATLPNCLLNQRGGKVIVKDPSICDLRYMFYALSEPGTVRAIALKAHGAANQANVSPAQVESVEVPFPPFPVQRRIADVLSAYDELIDNSQRRIRVLETMARVLYGEWFVNYRFPGHEKVTLVDSPMGKIPEGWEVKKLADLISYNRRATKPGPHLDGRRYVPIDCLPSKSLALADAKAIEEAQSSLQLFERGDILFGAMRPYFHKVVVAPFAGVTRTTCFVFKPRQPDWHAFATMTVFDEATVAHANAHSQGATIPYAVWDGSLANMSLVLPPSILLRRFEKTVKPMIERIRQTFFVLNNLRRTRELLLPKLISGDVDASRAMEQEVMAV